MPAQTTDRRTCTAPTRACLCAGCRAGFLPDGRLVLFDFGLASLWRLDGEPEDDLPRPLTGQTGSLRYMAPEVQKLGTHYSHKAEAFSFATVLWEMAAHRKPFDDVSSEYLPQALANGHRPPIRRRWPVQLSALLAECWQADAARRPEMRDAAARLHEMMHAALAAEEKRAKGSRRR